jgi:hypothetical protein
VHCGSNFLDLQNFQIFQMLILYLFLFTTAFARSENILIDQVVDSTMTIISNQLNKGLLQRINAIKFPSESARKEFSEHVSQTLTKPLLAQERLLVQSEVDKVLEVKQSVHLLKALKSLCNKIIEKIKVNTQQWAKKHIVANGNMINSLSKRGSDESESGKLYKFPHIFSERTFTSSLLEQFFWLQAINPLQFLFANGNNGILDLNGNFNYWLLTNFLVSPLFNRIMYGYYFYEDDKVEYY